MTQKELNKINLYKKIYKEIYRETKYFLKYKNINFEFKFYEDAIVVYVNTIYCDNIGTIYISINDYDLSHFYERICDIKEYCKQRFGY